MLPYIRCLATDVRMKTTVVLDDAVAKQLRKEAAQRQMSMSAIVEDALRRWFSQPKRRLELPPLPTFDGGGTALDVADRDALYEAMEGR